MHKQISMVNEKTFSMTYLAKQTVISGKPQIILGVSILSKKTHLHDTQLKLVDITKYNQQEHYIFHCKLK